MGRVEEGRSDRQGERLMRGVFFYVEVSALFVQAGNWFWQWGVTLILHKYVSQPLMWGAENQKCKINHHCHQHHRHLHHYWPHKITIGPDSHSSACLHQQQETSQEWGVLTPVRLSCKASVVAARRVCFMFSTLLRAHQVMFFQTQTLCI